VSPITGPPQLAAARPVSLSLPQPGAHNICAGRGSCARLLAAGGTKLGQARRPDLGIGVQDERLATELHGAQSSCTYLLIRLLAAETIGFTKFLDGECRWNAEVS
jgi:hypothetical protein